MAFSAVIVLGSTVSLSSNRCPSSGIFELVKSQQSQEAMPELRVASEDVQHCVLLKIVAERSMKALVHYVGEEPVTA